MRQQSLSRRRARLCVRLGIFFLSVFSLTATAAADNDGFAYLDNFLQTHRTLAVTFSQTTHDKDNTVLESSDGTLWFRAPDQFRMAYEQPHKPLLIADGKQIWFYESDIRQVVIRPYAAGKNNALLSVLADGGLQALQNDYVLSSGRNNTQVWLNAESNNADQSVRKIRLGFAADTQQLQHIQIADAFGGSIRIRITEYLPTKKMPDDFFTFTPPPDTEIIHIEE